MKHLHSLLTLFLALFSLATFAQEEDWFLNKRPECLIDRPTVPHGGGVRRVGSQTTAPLRSHGVQYVPVVLTAFPDKPFIVSDSAEVVNAFYDKYCNGTRDGRLYTGHGSRGSIRDYFIEQSDSAFLPEFVVIGPIVLDSVSSYYGANSAGRDARYGVYTKEAISKAYGMYENWSLFDNDGNGSVDMVFMLFAGLGENNGGGEDCIWPKETTSSTVIDGHVFATSAATCELRPTKRDSLGLATESALDGVGVFIHELSHALGLPDFYDINYVGFGMDLWSVMDYGEYGNNGYNPGNYTAYERDFMGWRPLVTLNEPCVLTIPCFADGGTGYKIQNEGYPDEYYIIENRQPKGWDDRVCRMGHGLQVTHVDYDAGRWNSNTVNANKYHQRMTIIAANNNYNGTNSASSANEWRKMLAGSLYPGDTENYSLTDESTPAAQVFSGSDVWVGSLMHKPLRNITENADGTVTVCFRTNGRLATPVDVEVSDLAMDKFTARWSPVENATRYVSELSTDNVVLRRDTLTETLLHVEGLPSESHLTLRVLAMADSPEDYVESLWSESCTFSTLADRISATSAGESMVEVFTLGGVCVSRCPVKQLSRLALHRGIYVIRYADGTARKVAN